MPTNTVDALLNIFRNPAQNVSSIYSLSSATAPFAPFLPYAPSSWATPVVAAPAAPTISPSGGTYSSVQTVSITNNAAGTVVRYTTDGSTPTNASPAYTVPITVSASKTIKAISIYTNNYNTSPVASANYTISFPAAATPVITLAGGTYTSAQMTTITDSSPGAAIYFTTDGSTPTTSSSVYTAPLTISASAILKAIAAGANYTPSAVASASYTINIISGTLSTFAGNGNISVANYAGDGGQAYDATLYNPAGLAYDTAGNLYFSDSGNCRLRRITPAGVISTVAGNGTCSFSGDNGQAASATLNSPQGIAIDGNNNLYIADYTNHRIRKVVLSSGVITTVAGTGSTAAGGSTNAAVGEGGAATSAPINNAAYVVTDSAGNFYYSDTAQARIRKVTVSSGIVTTIAGTGSSAFTADGNAAASNKIYFPEGMAFDAGGNMAFAESSSNRVRKIDFTTGLLSTLAGNGTGTYYGNNVDALSASLYAPTSVRYDTSGNLYIVDGTQTIRKVTAATNKINTVAGNATYGYIGDGGPAASAGINNPTDAILDSAGNLYIADKLNNVIRKVDTAGYISTFAGNGRVVATGDGQAASTALVPAPQEVRVGQNGGVYVVDNTYRIRRIDPSSGYISTVIGINGTPGPAGYNGDGGPAVNAKIQDVRQIAFDSSGNLYFTEYISCIVRKIDVSTGIVTAIAGTGSCTDSNGDGGAATAAHFKYPYGLAIASNGDMYVSEYYGCRVRKITKATGLISTYAGTGTCGLSGDGGAATSAQLSAATSQIALDTAGNLYIADQSNYRVRKVDTSGNISTFAGTVNGGSSGDGGPAASAVLNNVKGVATDASGNVYVTNNASVRKIDTSGTITTYAGNPTTAGFGGDGGPATASSAKFSTPFAVTLNSAGDLFVADYGNNRIRKVSH